jgi:hypothetical protein
VIGREVAREKRSEEEEEEEGEGKGKNDVWRANSEVFIKVIHLLTATTY